MFTGMVQAMGKVVAVEHGPDHLRLTIDSQGLDLSSSGVGDSIAVNGVCLTVTKVENTIFSADVSPETLARTTLGDVGVDASLNLELAVMPTTRLGGHMVSGHVDGIGDVVERATCGEYVRMSIMVSPELAKYIAEKGSVCVNGVSLTVNAVSGECFDVMLIPHTLDETNLQWLECGSRLNIEVDMIARYVERLMQRQAPVAERGGITREFLSQHGYIKE